MKKNLFLLLLAFLPVASLADATPVKLSILGRSMFYRGGRGYVGNAGFNGGSYFSHVLNGTFDDYRYQNTAGAEIVIPTTGLDENENDTGVAWYVTEFKVGHKGNTKYSLYYTTEPAPDYSNLQLKKDQDNNSYYEVSSDSRTWIPIDGATGVQSAGTTIFNPNVVATAVKYVFDTTLSWTVSLAEVEVWGLDPANVGCQHPSYTDWEVVQGSATCTTFGTKRRKCQTCGDSFEQADAPPLGHDWETHLTTPGSSSNFGSGTLVCSRCGESIVFNIPLDLATLGGVAIPGKIQFTDLSVSSITDDSGAGPDDLIDGNWTWDWGAYWFARTRSESEYVQYDFGTEIDITKIEWSAPNQTLTLKFYLWDGATEEPLVEIPVVKDNTGNGYQRGSMDFRGVVAKGIRLHIVDTKGVGYNGLSPVGLSELHPWGTVIGAGKLDVLRSKILLY